MRGMNMLVMYGILQGMQLADATVSGSNRRWPQSSRRISAPLHSAIGFGTKLPTRSGNSAYPQNTCTPAGWFGKVRLVGQHDGHQPVRVLERHQTADARLVAAESNHLVEECGVLQRDRERLPTRLRNATVEDRGIAKLRPALRQLLPKIQPPLSALVSLCGRGRHRAQAGGIGHGAVLHEDKVAVIHRNRFVLPCRRQWIPVTMNLPPSVL